MPRHYSSPLILIVRRANLKMDKESTKNKLLQSDQNLTTLQQRLEQKKAERLELQQKSKNKSNSYRPATMLQEKVVRLSAPHPFNPTLFK